jgi:hypothetical protein
VPSHLRIVPRIGREGMVFWRCSVRSVHGAARDPALPRSSHSKVRATPSLSWLCQSRWRNKAQGERTAIRTNDV